MTEKTPHKTTGLTHLINSTRYSLQGLKSAVKNEAAFRHELFLGIFAVPLAFWLGDDKFEIALMLGAYLLVLITELLNSSVECAIDRIGTEYHELSGRGKDQGSAAVFVALVNCAVVWLLMIFG
ncbi:diacylglycerol kinase [Pasteurellaceae bacterium Pebbles2]|nr:diacylglycerol kinase [Pasteurellaceae bacterium Pebbles2]